MPRGRVIPTVRVVHVCPPILVQTDLSNFQAVVQELTGKRKMIGAHNEDIAHLVSCHVCDHDPNRMQTLNELDSPPAHTIEGCNEGAGCDNNQCSYECLSAGNVNEIGVNNNDIGGCVRESFLMPKHDGCLSPNWSTNSSSSNNSFTYNEVTSSLINMATGSAIEEIACINSQTPMRDMPKLVSSDGECVARDGECIAPSFACTNGGQLPSKRPKLTSDNNYLNQESHFNYLCNGMEHILSHHAEESTLISGFITPPLFSLSDEQLAAEYGDHDLLQDLYDMEIFPISAASNLPG